MLDPRFATRYSEDYRGPMFYQKLNPGKLQTVFLPASVMEEWCEPGYQKKKPDKGVMLTVNDYGVAQQIYYGGGEWPNYVYTPFPDPN